MKKSGKTKPAGSPAGFGLPPTKEQTFHDRQNYVPQYENHHLSEAKLPTWLKKMHFLPREAVLQRLPWGFGFVVQNMVLSICMEDYKGTNTSLLVRLVLLLKEKGIFDETEAREILEG